MIVRHGHTIDDGGLIHYKETRSTFANADKLAGKRLDRRRNYCIIDSEVCVALTWTQACSGCTEGFGLRGMGCHECGYHGMSRSGTWLPLQVFESYERAGRES